MTFKARSDKKKNTPYFTEVSEFEAKITEKFWSNYNEKYDSYEILSQLPPNKTDNTTF
jgi:hypothetical protein